MSPSSDDTISDLDVISKLTPEGILLRLYEKIDKNNRATTQKLHKLDKDFEAQRTLLNTVLPRLATQDHVRIMFGDHFEECREKRKKSSDRLSKPSKTSNKNIAKIGAAIAGLSGAAWAIVEILSKG
jgi:hypothetical protein